MATYKNTLLTTKGLSKLLYEMGRTFDGLNSTRLATEEFLKTGNPEVIGSKNDLALLEDLRDASSFVLHYDYANKPFDAEFAKAINSQLKRTAAVLPGQLRDSQNVQIRCTENRTYIPEVPSESELDVIVNEAVSSKGDLTAAATLFCKLAKMQPFGDGNKRTALLAANGLLLKQGKEEALSIPADSPETTIFNSLLSEYYLTNNDGIIPWLVTWNNLN